MENYLSENEEYEVIAQCKNCNKDFKRRSLKKDLGNIRCSLCESINIEIFSTNPVRQILME